MDSPVAHAVNEKTKNKSSDMKLPSIVHGLIDYVGLHAFTYRQKTDTV